MYSILLLPLMAKCLETIDICIWRMFFMSVVVTVWGSVVTFVVSWPLLKIVFFNLGVVKFVVYLRRKCDGCCVFCLNCEVWSCRCLCMGSMSGSECRCCMFMFVLFIMRSRLVLYSAGSLVNRVQVILFGISVRLFCFVQAKTTRVAWVCMVC